MRKNRTVGERIFATQNNLILLLITLACFIPVWHVFCASVSDPSLLNSYRGAVIWPMGKWTFSGYEYVLQMRNIWKGYLNTIIYVALATSLGVLLTCFAAYALSRRNFLLKRPVAFLITFTMLFNGGLVPTYLIIRNLKMLNTIWAIILPNCVSVFNVMIMKNSFDAIPVELNEAAEIDGAGHFRTLFQIILPVSKSIFAVVTMFYLIQQWNSWFHTALYVNNTDMYPLQLWLREIIILGNSNSISTDVVDTNDLNLVYLLVKYCAIVVSIIPMLVLYPFIQKYMVNGVMVGAVKG